MNTEALFLFLILLLGLVLCSFLGGTCGKEGMTNNSSDSINRSKINNSGNNSNSNTNSGNNFDNYNHFSGSSTLLTNGSTFYGPNGGNIIVSTDSNGKQTLRIKLSSNENEMIFNSSETSSSPSSFKSKTEGYTNYYGNNGSATTFYGPNNASATVINSNDGQLAINVQTSNGSYTFTQSGSTYNPNNTSSTQYYGPNGGSAGSVTGSGGNTAYYAQGPYGNTVAGTTSNGYDYSNSLPPGVPRSQIPPGQEDLYILKSEVVPPVCPVCPVAAACPRQEPCPACPPCGRCPEPSFECKKVPNYSAINDNFLPQPVISDFSSFGM